MPDDLTDEQRANLISALLREKHGYETHGDKTRAAQVDVELHRLGHQAKAPAKRAQTRTR